MVLHWTFAAIQLVLGSPSYTVAETDGSVDNLITILKANDGQSEQDLEVFVQLAPESGDESAENGQYT